jgi:hypothetical protein
MRLLPLRWMLAGAMLGALSAPAPAVEDFDKGKTPAQMFRTDCGICHRTPSGLGAKMSPYALASFLTVHYTASRAIAGVLASYLISLRDPPQRQRRPRSPRERSGIGSDRTAAAAVGANVSAPFDR